VGGKRTEDAQLFVSIKSDGLTFGFYVGEYGPDAETRFLETCRRNKTALVKLLRDSLTGGDLIFGDPDRYEELPLLGDKSGAVAWDEWLADPGAYGTRVVRSLKPSRVIEASRTELAGMIYETFRRLFPLVLLASHDNPIQEITDFLKEGPDGGPLNPTYTLEQCAKDTHFPLSQLERWVRAIERKKQAIFYGPPGTGKTFIAEKLAGHLIGGQDGFREIVQFHPSYAYEDFVQGLRPKAVAEGRLEYSMVPGRFTEFCRAAADVEGRCVLVIDEINRANLSRVLGELMFLLEYRDKSVPLASGGKFRIPENVRIIGTMNTADRSIALVDHALRRRFAFLALYPDYEVLQEFHDTTGFDPKGLIEVLDRLNSAINDRHYEVGISFFLHPDIGDNLQDIWEMEIEPYIEELFFDQADTAAGFRWEKVKGEMLQ
jgi:5-methylcytosine-specific restriction protein B